MEAVPRLHMLWFASKVSPEGTSFMGLKKCIAELYQEDPESYAKEIFSMETLRNQAMHSTKESCAMLKRYYCQLNFLINRIPVLKERDILSFTWKELYHNQTHKVLDVHFEMAAVLFNIAATHTQLGASITRGDVDGMKLACTHFQCAAWCIGELRKRYDGVNNNSDFMTPELLIFMQQVALAQAQECILEKSLIDNRKPNIVAKVTAQIIQYYETSLVALLTGGDNGPISQVVDGSVYKLWKKYVRFKIAFLNCILYLYQGQHAEELQKMGERVALYQAAWEKLEDARKESKGLPDQKEINESLSFTADVVEGKRKNAKNENEFIYHEVVPEMTSISGVQGANLVNGIAFSMTDPDVAGEDIFARLIPMKVHEASSLYSEEKAKLLRTYAERVEEKDSDLAHYMSSLHSLEHLNINEEKANKIPQGIVDRCAALNAKKTAIPDLISIMAQLADICADVEINLKDINIILSEEEQQEKEFQKITGVIRTPPNAHIIELTREYQKYIEAHARAGESNDTLRKAMEMHVNNLKILALPLNEIQHSAPKLSSEVNMLEVFKNLKLILNKVNEMKAQRAQLMADLRIAIKEDDITSKVIVPNYQDSDSELMDLFKSELKKHSALTQVIDQNLLAQNNILQALTESYAKAAPVLKTLADVKYKRESFFSSLAASYDIYEDLLLKSTKGLEFYKKLAGNVQKLLNRLKSARDVQVEERQQRLKMTSTGKDSKTNVTPATYSNNPSTPKLRDFLKMKNNISNMPISNQTPTHDVTNSDAISYKSMHTLPEIRPNPLGSENPTQPVCTVPSVYFPYVDSSMPPNEPPPVYNEHKSVVVDNSFAKDPVPPYQSIHFNVPQSTYMVPVSTTISNACVNSGMTNIQLPTNTTFNMDPSSVNHQLYYGQYNQNYHAPPTYNPITMQGNTMNNTMAHTEGNVSYSYNSLPNQQLRGPTNELNSAGFRNDMNLTAPGSFYTEPYDAGSKFMPSSTITSEYSNQFAFNANSSLNPTQTLSNVADGNNSNTGFNQITNQQMTTPTSDINTVNTVGHNMNSSINSQSSYINSSIESSRSLATNQNALPNAANIGQVNTAPFTPTDPAIPIISHTKSSDYSSQDHYISQPSFGVNNLQMGPYYYNPNLSNQQIGAITSQENQWTVSTGTAPAPISSPPPNLAPHPHPTSAPTAVPVPPLAPAPTSTPDPNSAAAPTSVPASTSTGMASGGAAILGAGAEPVQAKTMNAKPQSSIKKKTIDLLTDGDSSMLTASSLPPPILQPTVISAPTSIESVPEVANLEKAKESNQCSQSSISPGQKSADIENVLNKFEALELSSTESGVNLLDSILVGKVEDELTASKKCNAERKNSIKDANCDPLKSESALKNFHREVERYEKIIENLNVKTLNGSSYILSKWKDLNDALAKEENKFSVNIAKLFPEKNHTLSCVPFDHARVKLDRITDDYINAALINNLGQNFPYFIITQSPQQNTINDFWSMILSQRARTLICLHTPGEMPIDFFWPREVDKQMIIGEHVLKCVDIIKLEHSIEYKLDLRVHGEESNITCSVLQINYWDKSSTKGIISIAKEAIRVYNQQTSLSDTHSPLVLNCLTGSERCPIVVVAMCAILAMKSTPPVLINVQYIWYRICSHRSNSINSSETLALSMTIVLDYAHELLNERGTITSYQIKSASKIEPLHEPKVKDPFNELDPLWKLKD